MITTWRGLASMSKNRKDGLPFVVIPLDKYVHRIAIIEVEEWLNQGGE